MMFVITFGPPEDVTNPGQDGIQYSFPLTVVDTTLVGAPEEKAQTQARRVIVPISRSRLVTWRLAKEDLIKVLFEYGKRHVVELAKSNALPKEYTIRFPTITTISHPNSTCPFDPGVIEKPTGASIHVEQEKPRIGFTSQ
jgi:hypothetical protein